MNEKIIVYLYQYQLSFNDKEKLNKEIKTLFLKLMKKYNLDFYGFNKVLIYENKIYGCILEIEKLSFDNFFPQIIDLKIIIYNDVPFFLEFMDDEYFQIKENALMDNNKYYLKIQNEEDLFKYIEYGKIIYKNKFLEKYL